MAPSIRLILASAFAFAAIAFPASSHAQTYDLVLAGGRVMDPATGLDAILASA